MSRRYNSKSYISHLSSSTRVGGSDGLWRIECSFHLVLPYRTVPYRTKRKSVRWHANKDGGLSLTIATYAVQRKKKLFGFGGAIGGAYSRNKFLEMFDQLLVLRALLLPTGYYVDELRRQQERSLPALAVKVNLGGTHAPRLEGQTD